MACPEGEQAAFMREARTKIDLASLGIGVLKARKGLSGALVLEVPGAESAARAETDALATRLRQLAAEKGQGYRVQRPVRMAGLRI